MKKTLTLAPGAVIEPVGDDVMVMMPGNTDILRISGPAADTLRTIAAGHPIDPTTPTVLELADQGIIQTSAMSRRGLIRAGAVGAGAGIAVLAMPSVAAAASVGGGGNTILGTWTLPALGVYTGQSIVRFNLSGFDFPNDLGEGSFASGSGGATPPGPLVGLPTGWSPAGTIGSETLTNSDGVRLYKADGTAGTGPGTDIVQWEYSYTGTLSGPLSASFVWGGVTYPVTFQAPA